MRRGAHRGHAAGPGRHHRLALQRRASTPARVVAIDTLLAFDTTAPPHACMTTPATTRRLRRDAAHALCSPADGVPVTVIRDSAGLRRPAHHRLTIVNIASDIAQQQHRRRPRTSTSPCHAGPGLPPRPARARRHARREDDPHDPAQYAATLWRSPYRPSLLARARAQASRPSPHSPRELSNERRTLDRPPRRAGDTTLVLKISNLGAKNALHPDMYTAGIEGGSTLPPSATARCARSCSPARTTSSARAAT